MGGLTGGDALIASIKDEIDKFKAQCAEEMKTAARTLTRDCMDRTPVWAGEAIVNYAWGVGGASGGHRDAVTGPPPRGSRRAGAAVGPPELGSEENRGANEAVVLAEMEAVLGGYKELETLVLTNHSEIWELIDAGSAPTPERARNPGGVSDLAEQATKAAMADTFK